jgi:hypothetical protein
MFIIQLPNLQTYRELKFEKKREKEIACNKNLFLPK